MVKGIEVEHNIDKEKEEGSLKTEVEKIEAIRSLRVNFDIWKCWIILAITLFIRKKLFYLYTMKRFKKLKSVGLQYYGDNFIYERNYFIIYTLYTPIVLFTIQNY